MDDTNPLANTAIAIRPQGISYLTVFPVVSRSHFAGNHFVDVAPNPLFSGLDRAHHGMVGVMKMFGGMFVLRRITATHIPADHAHPEVNPGVAEFDTLFTDVDIGGPELDLIQVLAFLSHLHLLCHPERRLCFAIAKHNHSRRISTVFPAPCDPNAPSSHPHRTCSAKS